MRRIFYLVLVVLMILLTAGCRHDGQNPDNNDPDDLPPVPDGLIQPSDLVYQGAFRLPDGSNGSDWNYSAQAAAYYPKGDAAGPADGYPGSIFAAGHDWQLFFSEITIPVPLISATKNVAELNFAATLQPFTDVRSGVGHLDNLQEMVRVGLEYLPRQGSQQSDKLYLCWGAHLQDGSTERVASHMWCDVDLTNPQGAWWVGDQTIYSVNDYLFEIPENWANENTPGKRLATGRFRDGGWSGQGPSLFAIGPWNQGDPPPDGTVLDEITLLLYSSSAADAGGEFKMNEYRHSDEWTGGAWLETDDKAAVIFVGTKGTGDCWYGDENGPCLDCVGQRGWWSTGFKGQIIFYDPKDLAAVAKGLKQPYEPQPYASLAIDSYLYQVVSDQQKYHVRGVCFDRTRRLLYLFEFRADEDKCLVHCWKISSQ